MHPRPFRSFTHALLAGSILIGLAACGDESQASSGSTDGTPAATTSPAPSTSAEPVTVVPTIAITPEVTLPATTVATTTTEAVVPVTEVATTEPATTVPDTTLPPTTVPVGTTAPIVAVTDDPCALLDHLEVAVTFGGDVQDARPITDPTGTRSCEWRLDADENSRATLTVTHGVVIDATTGWPSDPATVDGLGEQSFSYLDSDLHIGFVRAGLTVTLVVTDNPASTVPDWIALAEVVDRRITGQEPLPG